MSISYLTEQDDDEKIILQQLEKLVKKEKIKFFRHENFDYEEEVQQK